MNEPISPSDPMVILAGIRQFGLASDGSDLRDLEAAFARAAVLPPAPAGVEDEDYDDTVTAADVRGILGPAVPPAADIEETAAKVAGQHYAKLVQVFGARAILDADPTVIDALIASFVTALRAERERGEAELAAERNRRLGTEDGRDWHIDNAAELLARADAAEAQVKRLTAALQGKIVVTAIDTEIEELTAQVKTLREALGFAASVIKSGEPWTPLCEVMIGGALRGEITKPENRAALATKEPQDVSPPVSTKTVPADDGRP